MEFKELTVKDLKTIIKKYNIPDNAKIELATGWECGPVHCHRLFYNIFDNILAIIKDGTEDWYQNFDWFELK